MLKTEAYLQNEDLINIWIDRLNAVERLIKKHGAKRDLTLTQNELKARIEIYSIEKYPDLSMNFNIKGE